MARILINDNLAVNGKLTFARRKNEEGSAFIISGLLQTHLYIDDIKSLETPRFILKDVDVFEEDFGSDDYNIIYKFTCRNIDVKGYNEKGISYCITTKEMEVIEDMIYKNQHPVLGVIGEEFTEATKDFYKEEGEKDE